jgi:heat shock protein HslJ
MNPLKFKLPLFVCLLALSACSAMKTTAKSDVDPKVNGIVWMVTSFKGQKLDEKNFSNGLPSLIFDMTDSRINGSDGCNTFMGLAIYKADKIKTGPMATTKMACPGNTIQNDFYDALASPHLTYAVDYNGILRLYANDAELMAMKEKE